MCLDFVFVFTFYIVFIIDSEVGLTEFHYGWLGCKQCSLPVEVTSL